MDPKLIIVVKPRGSEKLVVLSGPEKTIPEQEKLFLEFRTVRTHAEYEEAHLCRLDVERTERMTAPEASEKSESHKPIHKKK